MKIEKVSFLSRSVARGSLSLLLACSAVISASAMTVTIDTLAETDEFDPGYYFPYRGQYYEQPNPADPGPFHSVNGTALVGNSFNDFLKRYASFFVFDVSGVYDQNIVSAKLRLHVESYVTDPRFPSQFDPSESFAIQDVSTDPEKLVYGGLGDDFYPDLSASSGDPYGTWTVYPSDAGTVIEIPLAAHAITDIMNAQEWQFDYVPGPLRTFTVGLALTSFSGDARQEGILFANGNGPLSHQLILEVLPVPDAGTTFGLLSFASLSCIAFLRMRRGAMR